MIADEFAAVEAFDPQVTIFKTLCNSCGIFLEYAEFYYTVYNSNAEDEANETSHLCRSCGERWRHNPVANYKIVLQKKSPTS
jgi:hypothetical protein